MHDAGVSEKFANCSKMFQLGAKFGLSVSSVIVMASKEPQQEDCGIIDLKDDSEYTWESSEEETSDEEDELRALDVDSSCRIQQTLFDLQYKRQNSTITNIDIEVVFECTG